MTALNLGTYERLLTTPASAGVRTAAFRDQLARSESLKRFVDVVVAGAALVALSPLFLVLACLIKLDGGPVFFRQKRAGKDGVAFDLFKFRSMRTDAEQLRQALLAANQHGEAGITFKMKDDPRVTRVGRVLRRLSLDEAPQLWNVLRGEMSVVGPRPAILSEVALYDGRQRRRLEVAPGLTCLWQVSGRADLPFETQVELDLDYIANRSFGYDLKLMAWTVPAVLTGRGAY